MQTYCRDDAATILEEIGRIGIDKCVNEISNKYTLDTRFLLKLGHLIDIYTLSGKMPMDVDVYKKYKDRLDWVGVTNNIKLDVKGIDFLIANIEKVTESIFDRLGELRHTDCHTVSAIVNYFLGRNKMETAYWDKVSSYRHLDSLFLRKYDRYINWYIASTNNRHIPVDIIIVHSDKMNWRNIWFNYKFKDEEMFDIVRSLTDNMLNIDWCSISANQNLSENFMNTYADMLNWDIISEYQNMSYEFLVNHASEINLFYLSRNMITSREIINKFLFEYNNGNLNPDDPNEPDEPVIPDNPDDPNEPDNPTNPDNPNKPNPDDEEDEEVEWEEF